MKLNEAARYRIGVASRAFAASIGGYALASAATALLSVLLPMPRVEAVVTATLLSILIYAGAVIWVFAARSAARAWLGIAAPTTLLALALLAYRSS
jgi:hypothetical protein